MSWLKSGDNAATYPSLLQAAAHPDHADERIVNEVAGFVWRCASQAAGHTTDYAIDFGTAMLMGGSRVMVLMEVAAWAGLVAPVPDSTVPAWMLIEDPEFLHMRLADEISWERQRDRDRKNPDLTMPVRLRDGDACRACGVVVNFGAKSGNRSGTYDHLYPGKPATVDTYFVLCRGCNSARKDGASLELRDPPAEPYYKPRTREIFAEHGYLPSETERPGTQPGNASRRIAGHDLSGPATSRATPPDTTSVKGPAARQPAGERTGRPPQRLGNQPGNAAGEHSNILPDQEESGSQCPDQGKRGLEHSSRPESLTIPRESRVEKSRNPGRDGSGRAGSGRVGTGRDGTGQGGAGADPPGRRRGRGGRRRRRGGE